ncbi:hypothetical protein KZJ38_34520 [Paraburkholderia edwinii]|uniref:Uncharacterized protein n=1 Tax=Paraburkholderia edwinii TaxID=2861782 RepID=A0ABX8UYY1_9BURK|nr:hypothetical protein [Paraburkholderia edwinii]QYD72068.1 hypothetical protein KZJ38_34520 [Paraburkholderia edwinii]
MPLYPNIDNEIRAHMSRIAEGERVKPIAVGRLTDDQHQAISRLRLSVGLPGLDDPEILLLGRHIHQSRVVKDQYQLDDVLCQIRSSLAETSVVHGSSKMTVVKSTVPRADGYGSMVRDEAVLELLARKPKAELFSVIPKGDIPPAKRTQNRTQTRPQITGDQKKERPLESGLEA